MNCAGLTSASPDEIWADYLDKMKQFEQSVKLVAFWTEETAKATRECADQVDQVIKSIGEYHRLLKIKDKNASSNSIQV